MSRYPTNQHEHTASHEPAARPGRRGKAAKDAGSKHPAHHADHACIAADFRKRFWISLIVCRFSRSRRCSSHWFLGHWIEMKSVMGASRALEELAKLMPSDAHKLMPDGSVKDVPLGELVVDHQVLIKPGEKAARRWYRGEKVPPA